MEATTGNPGSSAPVDLESIDLAEVIRILPGYDPYRDTGGAYFVEEAALHAIGFFHEVLTHVKGPLGGQPLRLEPWQIAVIGNLFGWLRPDGTRRYREGFVYIPRGNGKTTLSAGIPLYVLFCEEERGKEIYAAAADREQAGILFNIARDMVLAERELWSRCRVLQKSLVREDEGSFFRAISSDANTKHGANASCVVIDELHAQRDRELVDVLETSTGKRRQPIFLTITTADFDRPVEESICNEKHKYASDVRDGLISDPAFLPAIYEAETEDDWKDPAIWRKANPNLGVSVVVDDFERKFQKACIEPSFENTFKRLHLNMKTEQDRRFIRMEDWDRCAKAVDEESLVGRRCFAGLDLSNTEDITAFVLLFPDDDGAVLPYFWAPDEKAALRESRSKRAKYVTWSKDGLLELTPGERIDYDRVVARIVELAERFDIQEIGVDPWNASAVISKLTAAGLKVSKHHQGFPSMSGPTKQFEVMVVAQKLAHGGHRILRWMASNVAVDYDSMGNLKPAKGKSADKIDGIVALIMAIGAAALGEEEDNVYLERGFQSL